MQPATPADPPPALSSPEDAPRLVARLSHEYALRLVLLALLLVGWGVACVYDGGRRYPRENQRYAVYARIAETRQTDLDWEAKWVAYARGKGWDTGAPKHHSPLDLKLQFAMALICLPVGLLSVGLFVRNRSSRFSAESLGLHGWGATTIPYDAVERVDRRLWESKGIAVAWATVNGRRRRVTMDDWKWLGMEALVREVEQHLSKSPSSAQVS